MEKYAEISGSYLIFLITYLAVPRLTLSHSTGKKSCLIDVNYYTLSHMTQRSQKAS